MIKHIETVKQFKEEIASGTVLIDFYATWCGPCNMLAPVIEELDKQTNIKILKVDVDELPGIAADYGIQAIPTLFLLKEGKIVNKGMGYLNKNQLTEFVNK